MSRTITAYFDNCTDAQNAYDRLLAADVPASDLSLHDASSLSDADATTTATRAAGEEKGFWASLGDLFMPDEDRYAYSEGIRRGGSVLTVRTETADFDAVSDILEDAGAVNFDEREAEWRSSGWSGYETDPVATSSLGTTTTDTVATGTTAYGTTASGVTATGASSTVARSELAGETDAAYADRSDYIPVAEEQLRVGKREVDHGRVRVRSYVVETPVEENVSLRRETVRVERNAVDRPATDADHLFRDQVIEAEAHNEEAVVSKDARIVEEVRLNKDVDVRNETVRDTVRRTEVEVDDAGLIDETATARTTTSRI